MASNLWWPRPQLAVEGEGLHRFLATAQITPLGHFGANHPAPGAAFYGVFTCSFPAHFLLRTCTHRLALFGVFRSHAEDIGAAVATKAVSVAPFAPPQLGVEGEGPPGYTAGRVPQAVPPRSE